MTQTYRRLSSVALAAVLSLTLAACDASSLEDKDMASGASAGYGASVATIDAGSNSDDDATYDMTADNADSVVDDASDADATDASSEDVATESQLLVYEATVSIDATDYDGTVAAIRALVTSNDGFLESEDDSVSEYDGRHHWSATVRVPAWSYDAFMSGIDGAGGTVTSRSSDVTNVTREHADNDAVIESLEVQESRLLEMMESATTTDDMLAIESRLTEVQTQLNRWRSSQDVLEAQVALSTVTVSVDEVEFETVTEGTSYMSRVLTAFAGMATGFVSWLGDAIITLIYLIPVVAIAVLVVVLVRHRIRIHRKPRRPIVTSTPEPDAKGPTDQGSDE